MQGSVMYENAHISTSAPASTLPETQDPAAMDDPTMMHAHGATEAPQSTTSMNIDGPTSRAAVDVTDRNIMAQKSSWKDRTCFNSTDIAALHEQINKELLSTDFDASSPFGDIGFLSSGSPDTTALMMGYQDSHSYSNNSHSNNSNNQARSLTTPRGKQKKALPRANGAARKDTHHDEQAYIYGYEPAAPSSSYEHAQDAGDGAHGSLHTSDATHGGGFQSARDRFEAPAPGDVDQTPSRLDAQMTSSSNHSSGNGSRPQHLDKQFSIRRRGTGRHAGSSNDGNRAKPNTMRLDEHFEKEESKAQLEKPQITSLIEQFQILLHEQQASIENGNSDNNPAVDVRTKEQYKAMAAAAAAAGNHDNLNCNVSVGSTASNKSTKSKLMRKLHGVVRRRGSMGPQSAMVAQSKARAAARNELNDADDQDSIGATGTMSLADSSSVGSSKSTKKKFRRRFSGRTSKHDIAAAQLQQQQQQHQQLQEQQQAKLHQLQKQAKQREDEYLDTIEHLQQQNRQHQEHLDAQAAQIEQLQELLKWNSIHELATMTTEMAYYKQRFIDATRQRQKQHAKLLETQEAVVKKEVHISQLEHEVCKQEQKIIHLQSQLLPFTLAANGMDSGDDDSFHFGSRDDDTTKSFGEDSLIGGTVATTDTTPLSSSASSKDHSTSGAGPLVSIVPVSTSPQLSRHDRKSLENKTPSNHSGSGGSTDAAPTKMRHNGSSSSLRSLRSIDSLSFNGSAHTKNAGNNFNASSTTPAPPGEPSTPSRRSRRSRKTPRGLAEADVNIEKVRPVDCLPSHFQNSGANNSFAVSPTSMIRKTGRLSKHGSVKRNSANSTSSVSSGHSTRTNGTPKSKVKRRPTMQPIDVLEGVAPPASIRRSVSMHNSQRKGGFPANHIDNTMRYNRSTMSSHRRTRPTPNRLPPRRSSSMTNAPKQRHTSQLDGGSEHSLRSMERKALIFSKLDGYASSAPVAIPAPPKPTANNRTDNDDENNESKDNGNFTPTVPPSA